MHEAVAILLCVLAVFGLYALFARVAVMLLPRGAFMISVDGRDRTVEDILLLTGWLVSVCQSLTKKGNPAILISLLNNKRGEGYRGKKCSGHSGNHQGK